MWTLEKSIETSAPTACIWELFADVGRWKDYNADLEAIEIEGPFETGTSFTMTIPGQNALRSTLIEVIPGESFKDETVIDETRIVVCHRLVPLPSGHTKIIYSTEIIGPGADQFGPMVTSDFGDILEKLKKLAESLQCISKLQNT
ncbi:MAG: SRPBCC family protein [Corticimicrobacter sp.]|uniref:SRPBCC family protein n=1 Tax=Corticimicrobacter sp. TaxID=2678536 RepID=UPI0032DBDD4D